MQYNNFMYDVAFIGCGPSSIFAVLTLLKNGYKGNILMVDKGKSLDSRDPKEVINGWAGAGCFSDSKVSSSLDVGGNIPSMTQKDIDFFDSYILGTLNIFKSDGPTLDWDSINQYDTSSTSLKWDTHNICHVGTENGRAIYSRMEEYIKSCKQVNILFETEVEDVIKLESGYQLVFKNGNYALSTKVVVATGQKDKLPKTLVNKFNMPTKPRCFQLGVRVEDTMNPQYEDIIKANYDFKFVKTYQYGDVKVRVRTFCCNSGNAHTCEEKAPDGFSCFNGHSFKTPDPNNHTVNYGIICEVEGLKEYNSMDNQIKLMKEVNALPTWRQDNFKVVGLKGNMKEEVKSSRKLLEGFPQLEGVYPQEVLDSLTDFVSELSKLVDLSKATYLYPEIKLTTPSPEVDLNTLETTQKGLYMIGDAIFSRGIYKASYLGYKLAKGILGGNEQ